MTETHLRYWSVYGAMVALQVRDHMREGRGAPTDQQMELFVEEAETVAKWSEEVRPTSKETT